LELKMSRKGELVSIPTVKREDQSAAFQDQPRTEWLTAQEAAAHLRVKTRTLLLWTRQGKVKGYVLSGTRRHVWRFRCDDLDAAFFQPADLDVLHSALSSVRSAEMEAAR
jgi:excisionase family DNA binding protein